MSDLLPLVRAQGVLQRLVVVKATAAEKKKFKADFGVVAGGRRLACLKALAREKAIKPNEKIDCLLIPASASIAENAARKNLHPVDELHAFAALVASGTTIEEVAATFGVMPKVVERRLRLTTVSPKLLDEYRADNIKLEQLMALALSDDHAAQEAVWFDGPEWDKSPNALRRALVQDEPNADTDRRVRFVGLDAYKATGGRLRTDLFSEGAGYVLDVSLLDQLARDRLHERAQGVQAGGWQTVHVSAAAQGVNVNLECNRIQPNHREPTKKEAKAQAKLEAALQKSMSNCRPRRTMGRRSTTRRWKRNARPSTRRSSSWKPSARCTPMSRRRRQAWCCRWIRRATCGRTTAWCHAPAAPASTAAVMESTSTGRARARANVRPTPNGSCRS